MWYSPFSSPNVPAISMDPLFSGKLFCPEGRRGSYNKVERDGDVPSSPPTPTIPPPAPPPSLLLNPPLPPPLPLFTPPRVFHRTPPRRTRPNPTLPPASLQSLFASPPHSHPPPPLHISPRSGPPPPLLPPPPPTILLQIHDSFPRALSPFSSPEPSPQYTSYPPPTPSSPPSSLVRPSA